jgi:hypothetical protein
MSYTSGMDEGSGMKETGKNFFKGPAVSRYFRYLRFCPTGQLLTLTTWRPPAAVASLFGKAGNARTSGSALRRLGAALFGSYEVVADDFRELVRLRGSVVVALAQYPQMRYAL